MRDEECLCEVVQLVAGKAYGEVGADRRWSERRPLEDRPTEDVGVCTELAPEKLAGDTSLRIAIHVVHRVRDHLGLVQARPRRANICHLRNAGVAPDDLTLECRELFS